jgi:hypothetical protein
VGFVEDKMTLGHFYLQVLHYVTASIIPPVPHVHILFLQNQSYIPATTASQLKICDISRETVKGLDVL